MAGEVSLRFDVDGLDELRAVTEAMASVQRDLPSDFKESLREKAEELAEIARQKVLAEPAYGLKHTGLRAKMAAGTSVEDNSDGVSVVVTPEGEDFRLPADMDEGGWFHPVFGHRDNWVHQGGYFSWFMGTMDGSDGEFEDKLGEDIDHGIDKIAGA